VVAVVELVPATPVVALIGVTVNCKPVAGGTVAETVNVWAIADWPNINNPPKIKLNVVFMISPFLLLTLLLLLLV
jgi:hypothetical protein